MGRPRAVSLIDAILYDMECRLLGLWGGYTPPPRSFAAALMKR